MTTMCPWQYVLFLSPGQVNSAESVPSARLHNIHVSLLVFKCLVRFLNSLLGCFSQLTRNCWSDHPHGHQRSQKWEFIVLYPPRRNVSLSWICILISAHPGKSVRQAIASVFCFVVFFLFFVGKGCVPQIVAWERAKSNFSLSWEYNNILTP